MTRPKPVDARFFAPRTPVAIVDLGDSHEAAVARALLEGMGAVTLLHAPGTPEDFLLVLGQEHDVAPYLLICGHGDGTGFVFGEYGEGIDTSALEGESMPPSSVAPRVRLPGCVVVSTACLTGRERFARAFMRGGIEAFVAPEGYPDGSDVPLFLAVFFHGALARGLAPKEAWERAVGVERALRTFVFCDREGTHRFPLHPATP